MGKPYIKELQQLENTYNSAMRMDLSPLTAFISIASSSPLHAVGSGGSLSAAHVVSYLHQRWANNFSKAITPLEAVSLPIPRNSCYWFLSAGGRNTDINEAFKEVANQEPKQICITCAKTDSPLACHAQNYSYCDIFEFDLASKRDGFLATNSLLAFVILASRAYHDIFCPDKSNLRQLKLSDIIGPTGSTESNIAALRNLLAPVLQRDSLLVLFGPSTQAAAFDLESKFTEASLGHILLSDYRNFAHGRHHWFAKRGNSSAVLAFSSDQENRLATKTLSLLPKDIPVAHLDFTEQGVNAPVAAIATVLHIVAIAGEIHSIDPGRPGVPAFGSKIYHLRGLKNSNTHSVDIVIQRKVRTPRSLVSSEYVKYLKAGVKKFISEIQKQEFSAVVFDYDGTLCSPKDRFGGIDTRVVQYLVNVLQAGVPLGIATGRGKSVSLALRKAIPDTLFNRIIIGYYNGAECGYLSDLSLPDGTDKVCSELEYMRAALSVHKDLQYISKITYRKYQITVEALKFGQMQSIWEIVNAIMHRHGIPGTKVFCSSHSVDIIAPSASKTKVVNMVMEQFQTNDHILCIGDMGAWPGNDYDLLGAPFSLSVDQVPQDSESCWNLAPSGYRGVEATLYYLDCMKIEKGFVTMKMKYQKKVCKP